MPLYWKVSLNFLKEVEKILNFGKIYIYEMVLSDQTRIKCTFFAKIIYSA